MMSKFVFEQSLYPWGIFNLVSFFTKHLASSSAKRSGNLYKIIIIDLELIFYLLKWIILGYNVGLYLNGIGRK